MKLLMYGVNKETVMKEDVEKYLLTEQNKKIQMNDISKFDGVEEIAVLTDDFRNEYYLYVDETVFSHGDFLRYIAEKTNKTLQDIILETYSKFNEDVLRHLFEITSGYSSQPQGAFSILWAVEKAITLANTLHTSGPVVYKMFKKAIYLAYALKLEKTIKPLNQSLLSKYIYLLQERMNHLEKKHYLVSGDDLQVYFLTKLLIFAGAQTVTIIQTSEFESQRQFERIKYYLDDSERTKIYPATEKSLCYRLSKADAAILNTAKIKLFDEKILEEVTIIRQTKKVQYLVDTREEGLNDLKFPELDLQYIDGSINISYNDDEENEAFVAFDEELNDHIERFMNFLEEMQVTERTESFY